MTYLYYLMCFIYHAFKTFFSFLFFFLILFVCFFFFFFFFFLFYIFFFFFFFLFSLLAQKLYILVFYGYLFFLFLFRATPAAHGGSQARGRIGATAASPHHSRRNMGSKTCLWPTSSWILVGFVSTVPQRELPTLTFLAHTFS